MANIESFPILCSSTERINGEEVGDLSQIELSRDPNNGEAGILTSISTDVETCNNISSRGIASLSSNIDDVVNNDVEVHYLAQALPQTNNNLVKSLTNADFDFHSVSIKEPQPSVVGSANLLSVPTTVSVNNRMYTLENAVKVEGSVNKLINNESVNPVFGLGQNSIKLIQQANQSSNIQNLTQEQLNQILKLIQRQQNNSGNQEAMLCDPSTQQKTVFKICYANQQVGNIPKANYGIDMSHVNQSSVRLGHNMQARRPQIDADVLMRIDKEHKKKHRPRTRSGRVSKPPQYMVKDYKHIHPVDYDEDYDDSDGGYSDFKLSSGEEDNKIATENVLSYESLKSKRLKCDYCEKSYVSKGGLNRHYRLNPTHGKPDDDIGNEFGDSVYSSDSFQSSVMASNYSMMAHRKNVRMDNDVTLAMEVYPNGESAQQGANVLYSGVRKIKRGRSSVASVNDKRKQKLYEVSKQCSDEDILELFVQRCPFTVSMWEILSLKNSKVYDSSVDSLLGELNNLHDQVGSYLSERLTPLSEDDYQSCEDGCDLSNKNVFEMVDDKLAACLNLPVGKYTVKSESVSEDSLHSSQHVGSAVGSADIKSNSVIASNKQHESVQYRSLLPPRKRLKPNDADCLPSGPKMSILNNGNRNLPMASQSLKNSLDISALIAGRKYAFNNFATQAALRDKKPIVFDVADDAMVSSTSHVNSSSPVGDNNSSSNLASGSGFASSLPDSSFQGTTSSSLGEIWSGVAKTSGEYQTADNINLVSMNSSSLLNLKEDKSNLYGQNINHSPVKTDPSGVQFNDDSYLAVPDETTSQEQGICVTCFPMQEYIQVPENARYIQTEDGLVIVKNPDSSYHIYGDVTEDITLEMLEAHFPPIN